MPEGRKLKLAGLCGMTAPVVAIICVLMAISLSPWFSWSANALSDLGVGEAAWVFNFGLMAGGILTVILAVGLFAQFEEQAVRRVGAILFLIDAVSLFGIGLFSEAAGRTHTYFSIAFFVLLPISLFLLGAGAIVAGSRRFGVFTIAVGILAALPWAFTWDAVAVPEMLSAITGMAWTSVQGWRLYSGKA